MRRVKQVKIGGKWTENTKKVLIVINQRDFLKNNVTNLVKKAKCQEV